MTTFRIEHVPFDGSDVSLWAKTDPRLRNWPVVYTLDDASQVYVGESHNVAARFRQHLETGKKALTRAHVVVDETFNKSACLDLESRLIGLFAGDGQLTVLNRNDGVLNADYYERERYQEVFDRVFDELRQRGLFSRSIPAIVNSDLFKLSPFKALTPDQAVAVEAILEGLFEDLAAGQPSTTVIQGGPGTGKTVIAVYLLKLLMDIKRADLTEPSDRDTLFSDFFVEGYPELLTDFKVGLVVPQQALRKSVKAVFKKTPGLNADMVLSAYDVGLSNDRYDLLVIDETHRLNQRANQSSGMRNRQYAEINVRLFGEDRLHHNQLDWIVEQSDHQIFLLDTAQSVRPADLPSSVLGPLVDRARTANRRFELTSQLRVAGGSDYIGYTRQLLSDQAPEPLTFPDYDFRLFDDLGELAAELAARETEHGLARLVAGYAWKWHSRKDRSRYDIEIDGLRLQWNTTDVDWVNSPTATSEVGSIHTVQGYDLNYAGVIIGRDLRWDEGGKRLWFDRTNHFDSKVTQNNKRLGITYTDEDLLAYIKNAYSVLLTRGMKGTYVYVVDPPLRERLRSLIPAHTG